MTDSDYHILRQRLIQLLESSETPKNGSSATIDRICAVADDTPKQQRRNRGNRSHKEEGELAEAGYVFMAAKNGVKNAKPEGDTLPFDRIAIARTATGFTLHTVQVRCTSRMNNGVYYVSLRHGGDQRRYQRGDFDFIAAWVVPRDAWYIIPFDEIAESSWELPLSPHRPAKNDPYRPFLNRWDLLR